MPVWIRPSGVHAEPARRSRSCRRKDCFVEMQPCRTERPCLVKVSYRVIGTVPRPSSKPILLCMKTVLPGLNMLLLGGKFSFERPLCPKTVVSREDRFPDASVMCHARWKQFLPASNQLLGAELPPFFALLSDPLSVSPSTWHMALVRQSLGHFTLCSW